MAARILPIRQDIGEGTWQSVVEHGIEAAAQTFKAGALLVNSTGSLAEGTTGTTGYAGLLIGFALGPATGVAGSDVAYTPMCPNIMTFSGSVDGTLVASNAPGTGSVAQSGCFGGIGIQRDAASGLWFLCTSGTASAIVVGFIDPPGTVNGRVRVRMLQAQTLLI